MIDPASSTPCLSVVVPARNVACTIEQCLTALLSAAPPGRIEVIVVDNGSEDQTLDRVRRFPVRLERIPPCFVARSRNVGAALARHPLLAFIDSDCVVSDGWFHAVVATLDDPTIGATGSRHVIRDDATWVERAWDDAHRRRRPTTRQFEVSYIPAGNLAVPRDLFAQLRGFDETLETGEDPDLCRRIAQLGRRIVEVSAIRCVHLGEPRALVDVFRRERWHGRGLRLRYADGRIAPIALTTGLFAVTVLLSVVSAGAALATGEPALTIGALAFLVFPSLYAARASGPRVAQFLRLVPIYTAYFLGRAAALRTVFARAGK